MLRTVICLYVCPCTCPVPCVLWAMSCNCARKSVCDSLSLFAFLSKSSEITFFYAMLLMLFAYVSCRLQYLQMNAVRCLAFGPWSSGPCAGQPDKRQFIRPTAPFSVKQTNYVCENSFISFSTIVTCPQSAILSQGPFSFPPLRFPLHRTILSCHLHFLFLSSLVFLYHFPLCWH